MDEIALDHEPPIETWSELKKLMRKKFIQSWYQRDMIKRLHRIIQGNKSVEKYYQELEVLCIGCRLMKIQKLQWRDFWEG